MNRLFPRAVPEALIALVLLGGACSVESNVKPGAPVLTMLSIIEPSGNRVDVTPDTPNCPMDAAEGKDCDPGVKVCELGANVVCTCSPKDMCDPSIDPDAAVTGGTLGCTFAPMTKVVATFDRLLATKPFDDSASVATVTSMSDKVSTSDGGADGGGDAGAADSGAVVPPSLPTTADYTSSGSTTGLVFPAFAGIVGPTVAVIGSPAAPTDSTVSYQFLPDEITAKDGKTGFTATGMLLMDGKIAFKTSSFMLAGITTPVPPAPMDMGGGSMPAMPMGCPMPATDAGASDGSSDGGETPSDAGGSDAPATAVDAAASSDASSDDGASDAGTAPPPPTDVQADMNMAPVVISFTNPVPATFVPDMTAADGGASDGGMVNAGHFTITEDDKPFTGWKLSKDQSFPSATVTIVPTDVWAPGKTYTVTVDDATVDVFNAPLVGGGTSASFTMAAK
jgi:hypothetical protein